MTGIAMIVTMLVVSIAAVGVTVVVMMLADTSSAITAI